jgi:hypothetical protein
MKTSCWFFPLVFLAFLTPSVLSAQTPDIKVGFIENGEPKLILTNKSLHKALAEYLDGRKYKRIRVGFAEDTEGKFYYLKVTTTQGNDKLDLPTMVVLVQDGTELYFSPERSCEMYVNCPEKQCKCQLIVMNRCKELVADCPCTGSRLTRCGTGVRLWQD